MSLGTEGYSRNIGPLQSLILARRPLIVCPVPPSTSRTTDGRAKSRTVLDLTMPCLREAETVRLEQLRLQKPAVLSTTL